MKGLTGLAGGMVGYHLLSQTLFARALGIAGRFAGIAIALVSVAVLFLGTSYLSILPIGVFAAVIARILPGFSKLLP